MEETDNPLKCDALKEDYFECLHHRKEFARMSAIARQEKRNQEAAAAEGAKS